MDNFIFSESLEISIIEHRMLILFEMLEKVNLNFFFPSILFNESFWQTPYEKRQAIQGSMQLEWMGQLPAQRSVFYKDAHFLELIKSIKVAYFSYTKLNLSGLLDIFKTKNRFSVTDFSSFGDTKSSPITFINDIYYKNIFANLPKEALLKKDFGKLPKIAAVKFYRQFAKKKEVKALIFDIQNSFNYWEEFLKSIDLIDLKQKTSLLESSKFYFTSSYPEVIDRFNKEIESFPTLKMLHEKGQVSFEELITSDFELKEKFDYIFSYYGINEIPTDILINTGRTYFSALGRLCYNRREDEKAAVEKVSELQSPMKHSMNLGVKDLFDIDYEIIWGEFENSNAAELLQRHYITREKSYTRFSVPVLSFLIKSIKSLKKDGYLEVWNLAETASTKDTLCLFRNENGKAYTLVDLNLYLTLLKSFTDIKIEHTIQNFQEFLSSEILDNKGEVIPFDQIINYASENKHFWEKFFTLDNFEWKSELEKIAKRYTIFSWLKKKGTLFFGLPTLLYNVGFKRFKNTILKTPKFGDMIDKQALINSKLNSYEKEFLVAATTKLFSNMMQEESIILTVKDKESPHNKDFYDFLSKVGMDKDRIMTLLHANWDQLVEYSNSRTNNEVMFVRNV